MRSSQTADEIIQTLGLEPHPEGGYFRETWRDHRPTGERGAGTCIYYLLKENQRSHWHRVDAAEIWHFYAGSPLELTISNDSGSEQVWTLGPQILVDQSPQFIVPSQVWQSARSLGAWTLVGCTVSPAFQFEGFEMAPPDWRP